MTAVVILLLSIVISFVVVRVGAAAFELTGMPWDQAKFQALSAFTNSGFTTAESEEITRHPMRRRVAAILIVLGNAGLVAVIGGFAGSLVSERPLEPLLNLSVVLGGVGLLVWISRGHWVGRRLRHAAKEWLDRRYQLSAWSPGDLLHLDEGYSLARCAIAGDSPLVGHRLGELQLKDRVVQILAIERSDDFTPVPRSEEQLRAGDELVVFGRATEIERLFGAEQSAMLEVIETIPAPEESAPSVQPV